MKELTIDAAIENIAKVTAFVDGQLEALGCPMKAQMQIDVAIDELFSNIACYAYDPLAKSDPDITLSAEEREIGGLGIYLVKKSMDEISYEYKDGQNILKIKKVFEKEYKRRVFHERSNLS